VTAKGAAQPDRPDETAPPSDGGAVSPGAANASDAARSGGKADSDNVPATSAKSSGDAGNGERGDRASDGRARAAAADAAADDKPDADKATAEKAAGDKVGADKAGATDSVKDRPSRAGTEDGVGGGGAGNRTGTENAAKVDAAKADAVKDTAAKKNKESEEVTQGKTAEEAVAPSGDQSDDNGRPFDAELETLRRDLGELTRDLQRVTAEYANYRKRVDRDRTLVAEQATGVVLTQLLPVLDDLDRARDHGDLVGPFGSVADQLVAALTKFGLTAFGAKGDPFDPTLHEAVSHTSSPDVTETTCVEVMRRGYLLGERLLRPALVGVADPE
jgi:molecular chaperone GrpE